MTTHDIHAPHSLSRGGDAAGTGDRLRRWAGNAIRALQYSRMRQALSELSDAQLAALGLNRADIPDHARNCVYDIHS